jgi:hypothetical protein
MILFTVSCLLFYQGGPVICSAMPMRSNKGLPESASMGYGGELLTTVPITAQYPAITSLILPLNTIGYQSLPSGSEIGAGTW